MPSPFLLMATIGSMKRRFEKVNTDDIIDRVMQDSSDFIADQNAEQMFHGERKDGDTIAPEYQNPDYAAAKNTQNPLPGEGVPDLRLTGAFYAGIYVKVEGDKIIYGSTDPKAAKLEKKYGKGIWGLNAPFKAEVMREKVRPGIKNKIFESTGLNMKNE
jgi:hypothetical protein